VSVAAPIERAPAITAAVRTSVRFGPALQVLSVRSIGSAWRDGDLVGVDGELHPGLRSRVGA
jgi:ABC-2 type transport system permease protein